MVGCTLGEIMKIIADGDVYLYLCVCRKDKITFTQVKKTWNTRINDTMETNFADEAIICLSTDGENFRKINYDWYKASRKYKEAPEHLHALKAWAFEEDKRVVGSPSGEADDEMMIRACDAYEANEPYVICTIDKDLKTIPGMYYNVRTGERFNISPKEAYDYMFEQFLTGDMGRLYPRFERYWAS